MADKKTLTQIAAAVALALPTGAGGATYYKLDRIEGRIEKVELRFEKLEGADLKARDDDKEKRIRDLEAFKASTLAVLERLEGPREGTRNR